MRIITTAGFEKFFLPVISALFPNECLFFLFHFFFTFFSSLQCHSLDVNSWNSLVPLPAWWPLVPPLVLLHCWWLKPVTTLVVPRTLTDMHALYAHDTYLFLLTSYYSSQWTTLRAVTTPLLNKDMRLYSSKCKNPSWLCLRMSINPNKISIKHSPNTTSLPCLPFPPRNVPRNMQR
jgi:hypothetical protein